MTLIYIQYYKIMPFREANDQEIKTVFSPGHSFSVNEKLNDHEKNTIIEKFSSFFGKTAEDISGRASAIKEEVAQGRELSTGQKVLGKLGSIATGGLLDVEGAMRGRTKEESLRNLAGESKLQQLGQAAGAVGDVAGEAISAVTPEFVKEGLSKAGGAIAETEIGKAGMEAAKMGIEKYNKWAEQNPEASKDLEAVVNIASIFPVGKGGQLAGKAIGETAELGAKGLSKAKGLLPESLPAMQKTVKEIEDVTRRSKPLANLSEKARKRGININEEIANSDVLRGAVDADGKITTIGEGGAIEKYSNKYIKGLDSKLSTALKENNERISIDTLKKKMMEGIDKTDLAGTARDDVEKRIMKEIDSLAKLADDNKTVPLERVNRVKQIIGKRVGKGFDAEKDSMNEALFDSLRNTIEKETKSVDVKDINKELSKHYTVRDFLEKMDGKGVAGTGLTRFSGEVASQVVGGGVGATVGTMVGGIPGTVIGGALGQKAGNKIGQLIRGRGFVKTFGKIGDKERKSLVSRITKAKDKKEATSIFRKFLESKAGGPVSRDALIRAGIISEASGGTR